MNILTIGPLWRGSNAGGLFKAFSRLGVRIEVIDEFYYISLRSKNKFLKVFERLLRNFQCKEFNNTIIDNVIKFKPDVLFVYKGAFVFPETLREAKRRGCKLVLFYPDVSMTAHGSNIPSSIPLYNKIFTTKTFGIQDLKQKFQVNNASFIPHGFDPEIHRKLIIHQSDIDRVGCDVSFIGTWSPKKEKFLCVIKENCPEINLKIWGEKWNNIQNSILKSSIQNSVVAGDLYAVAIQCSKINLGILSERIEGASNGDLITSRTFHIPACSGFMLHEKNEESVQYFIENKEAVFFENETDLISKIKYYLIHEQERNVIKEEGYKRAISEHALDNRVKQILEKINELI